MHCILNYYGAKVSGHRQALLEQIASMMAAPAYATNEGMMKMGMSLKTETNTSVVCFFCYAREAEEELRLAWLALAGVWCVAFPEGHSPQKNGNR